MAMTLNRVDFSGMLRVLRTAGAHLSRATPKRGLVPALTRFQSSAGIVYPASYVPPTSLSRPPWPELPVLDPEEEAKKHQVIVQKVKSLIEKGEFGRLFAVVHFAGRQWKVTNEDLILIENHIDAACGDRIRMEKVLLVGGNDFTLIGRPLLGPVRTAPTCIINCTRSQYVTSQAFHDPTSAHVQSAKASSNRNRQRNTLIQQNPKKCLLLAVGAVCDLVQVHATVIEKTESWPMVHMRFWKRHRFQKKRIIIQPQTVLRINTIDVLPRLV